MIADMYIYTKLQKVHIYKIICSNMYKLESMYKLNIFLLYIIYRNFKKLKKHQTPIMLHLCSEDPF